MTEAGALELHAQSVQQLMEGYRLQQFTPVEVLQSLLQAIGHDAVNAFTALDAEGALCAAQASTQRWQVQAPLSPLDGVPVSIKDLMSMAGLPARRGSLSTPVQSATDDAPAVQLLRQAGAVLFGKTTTTELGSAIHGDSPAHGRTLNPLDHHRVVGGSSCGAAAQLASHWGPLAIGSDAGGSVRIPASYTGTAAFKPSFGNIPAWPVSPFAEFAHLGPMARSVEDIVLAMQVIGQPHRKDPASLYTRSAGTVLHERSQPLRIGYCTQIGVDGGLDTPILQAMQELVQQRLPESFSVQYPQLALELVPIDLSQLHMAQPLWTIWCSRVVEVFLGLSQEQQAQLGPDLQLQYQQGLAQDVRTLAVARKQLREQAMQLSALFESIDMLLTPATLGAAPDAGEFVAAHHPQASALRASGNWLAATPFSHPFNVTQQPALVIPWVRNAQGLPLGLQLVGARHADALVLELGAHLQRWIYH